MATHPSELLLPKYRPDIDGLRAIAVLLVVGFHAFPDWIKGGFIGVDIFFVISGYLISTLIFENLELDKFSFTEFYARRIRRIFPALLIILVCCFCFGWFFLLPDEYERLGKHIAAGAGFVANFALWSESGYFDYAATAKPLLHLWSLGIEEQFYLVWPLLLWLTWKRRLNFLTITIAIAAVSFALNIVMYKKWHVADFYSPQTRFWELLAGTILSYLKFHIVKFPGQFKLQLDSRIEKAIGVCVRTAANAIWNDVLSLLGLLLIALGGAITTESHFPGLWAIMPVVGAVMIIGAGRRARINKFFLSSRPLVWIGLISYPLYMWHWPLLTFARIVKGGVPPVEARIAIVFLSILLAWATYVFLEKPIRYGQHRFATTGALIFCTALIGMVGLIAYARDGLRFRAISTLRVSVDTFRANLTAFDWPDGKLIDRRCLQMTGLSGIPYCLFDSTFDLRAALIGDSHANTIFEFLDNNANRQHKGLIMLGGPACYPFLGIENDKSNCPHIMQQIVEFLNSHEDIHDVFITARFEAIFSGIDFGGSGDSSYFALKLIGHESEMNRSVIFRTGMQLMIEALQKHNKKVTILLDVPELNFDPKLCLKSSYSCAIDKDVVASRQSGYSATIYNLQKVYGFRVIDLKKYFCDEKKCFAMKNGRILYRDRHHLSSNGNAYLINKNINLFPSNIEPTPQ